MWLASVPLNLIMLAATRRITLQLLPPMLMLSSLPTAASTGPGPDGSPRSPLRDLPPALPPAKPEFPFPFLLRRTRESPPPQEETPYTPSHPLFFIRPTGAASPAGSPPQARTYSMRRRFARPSEATPPDGWTLRAGTPYAPAGAQDRPSGPSGRRGAPEATLRGPRRSYPTLPPLFPRPPPPPPMPPTGPPTEEPPPSQPPPRNPVGKPPRPGSPTGPPVAAGASSTTAATASAGSRPPEDDPWPSAAPALRLVPADLAARAALVRHVKLTKANELRRLRFHEA